MSIGVGEPLNSSMWKLPKNPYIYSYIVSWLSLWFYCFGRILLGFIFFFCLPCGLARPLNIYIYIYISLLGVGYLIVGNNWLSNTLLAIGWKFHAISVKGDISCPISVSVIICTHIWRQVWIPPLPWYYLLIFPWRPEPQTSHYFKQLGSSFGYKKSLLQT